MQIIRKAVFPVAGMGTRFLPATKASPKEMLPIVDKPLIQFAVEEAMDAGCTEMIFITGRTKRAIEDHFDKAYELENELMIKGKNQLLKIVRDTIPSHIRCTYTRQAQALGLGHAIGCAESLVGDEPFAVLLADDLIDASPSALKQMNEIAKQHKASVIGVEEVPRSQTEQYGIVSTEVLSPRVERIRSIVEKPSPELAPSNLAVVGRYIFNPKIFSYIREVKPGRGGEIQITDAISAMLGDEKEQVIAYRFDGVRYDCGSKLGYLKATVNFGKKHPEVGLAFQNFLKQNKIPLSK